MIELYHTSIQVYLAYTSADEHLALELKKHLGLLIQQGRIVLWERQQIYPGEDRARQIQTHIEQAAIILVIVTADLLASDVYEGEIKTALERHEEGRTHVIPILARPCDWHAAAFAHLQWLPHNGKAIMTWGKKASAWHEVAVYIRQRVESIEQSKVPAPRQPASTVTRRTRSHKMPHLPLMRDTRAFLVGSITFLVVGSLLFGLYTLLNSPTPQETVMRYCSALRTHDMQTLHSLIPASRWSQVQPDAFADCTPSAEPGVFCSPTRQIVYFFASGHERSLIVELVDGKWSIIYYIDQYPSDHISCNYTQ